jgi:hypothetical protein
MGAAGLAFAALTISNPIALGTLAAGTLQTGLLCSSNIHRVEDSEETMAEFNANSILARYLLLVQSSLVRQLRNSYEQVKNAKTPEALASFTTITTRDADLFQLWSRVEKDLPDNRKMENTTPLSDEERIQLVKRLYNRIVKAFNSDLSIEDEILRCERYDSLPKDRNGRSIIEQVDDSLKCESYTEVDKTEGIWKARDAYEAEVMMKPEKDLAIKQILGNPRSLHDFFRSGLIRTMEGQPGVFEQNGRSFTNYIRKVYLRDIYRECTTLDGSVFYDRTTTPISEKCEVIYQMSYKDKFIRLGAGESSTKTDPGSETVPTASLR